MPSLSSPYWFALMPALRMSWQKSLRQLASLRSRRTATHQIQPIQPLPQPREHLLDLLEGAEVAPDPLDADLLALFLALLGNLGDRLVALLLLAVDHDDMAALEGERTRDLKANAEGPACG